MSVASAGVKAGLDALFLPDSVAVIGATERPGTVGRTILENLRHPSFQGKVYAVNSRHSEICGLKAYPSIGDVPEKVGFGGRRHARRHGPRHYRRMRGRRCEIGSRDLGGISRKRSGRRRTRTPDSGATAPRKHAPDWPQLPGHHESDHRPERHLRQGRASARQRRLSQPERRAADRDSRLGPAGTSGLQRVRLDRLHAGCRLGRPDLPLRRRSAHPKHPHLHGVGRRRPVISLGGARSGAAQAYHCDQGRPLGSRGPGRGFAHRRADRKRRGARCRLPPLRRAAGQHHRRPVLHGGGAQQAAAAQGAAADDPHQCRRARRAGHRRSHRQWRRTGRSFRKDAAGAERISAAALEPQQSDRHSRATPTRSATPKRSKSPPTIQTATACWSSSRRKA